jgi:hypothetical protein
VERLDNEIFVQVEDEILLVENQKLRNSSFGHIRTKVGNATVFGCMVLTGPETQTIRDRLCSLQQRKTYSQLRDEIAQPHIQTNQQRTQANAVEPAGLHLPSIVSVSDLNPDSKIVRFALNSEEEGYELLHEILRPLSATLVGYEAYIDRLCSRHNGQTGPRQQQSPTQPAEYSSSHPIYLLRQFDAKLANPTSMVIEDN